jgi:hypothetical protein
MNRTPDGKMEFRHDVNIVDTATKKVVTNVTREITNSNGTYLINNLPGSGDVAYLLTNDISPAERFQKQMEAVCNSSAVSEEEVALFSETQDTLWDKPVTKLVMNIPQGNASISPGVPALGSAQLYVDNTTGNIRRFGINDTQGNPLEYVEYSSVSVNQPVDPSNFSLPNDLQIVPVKDRNEAMQIGRALTDAPVTNPDAAPN